MTIVDDLTPHRWTVPQLIDVRVAFGFALDGDALRSGLKLAELPATALADLGISLNVMSATVRHLLQQEQPALKVTCRICGHDDAGHSPAAEYSHATGHVYNWTHCDACPDEVCQPRVLSAPAVALTQALLSDAEEVLVDE